MTTVGNRSTNSSSTKNIVLAIAMVLFLTLSFKLTGELTGDNTRVSQTDNVVNTLRNPNPSDINEK